MTTDTITAFCIRHCFSGEAGGGRQLLPLPKFWPVDYLLLLWENVSSESTKFGAGNPTLSMNLGAKFKF